MIAGKYGYPMTQTNAWGESELLTCPKGSQWKRWKLYLLKNTVMFRQFGKYFSALKKKVQLKLKSNVVGAVWKAAAGSKNNDATHPEDYCALPSLLLSLWPCPRVRKWHPSNQNSRFCSPQNSFILLPGTKGGLGCFPAACTEPSWKLRNVKAARSGSIPGHGAGVGWCESCSGLWLSGLLQDSAGRIVVAETIPFVFLFFSHVTAVIKILHAAVPLKWGNDLQGEDECPKTLLIN